MEGLGDGETEDRWGEGRVLVCEDLLERLRENVSGR